MVITPSEIFAKSQISRFKICESANSYLHSGKKYIMTDSSGISIYDSLNLKNKVRINKAISIEGNYITNGKTIYFTVSAKDGHRGHYIYSVKTNGKSLKMLKRCNIESKLITCYKNCIYYVDNNVEGGTFPTKLIKFNLKTKKSKCISGNHTACAACYYNKKIYFSAPLLDVSEVNSNSVYYVNLKNNKIKKVKEYATLAKPQYHLTKNQICFESFRYKNNNTYDIRICHINKNKLIKSKKLPNNSIVDAIFSSTKKAIISIPNKYGKKYYIFNLSTGKKKKISGLDNDYYQVKLNEKGTVAYFAKESSERLYISKLSGTKTKPCKIDNWSDWINISNVYSYSWWVVGNKLVKYDGSYSVYNSIK